MTVATAFWRRQASVLVAVTKEILHTPFAFGVAQAQRPAGQARDYLIEAGAIFLGATVLAVLGAWLWPDDTLFEAQTVQIALILAALLVGNGVALVLARVTGRDGESRGLVSAALYGSGFALLWLAAFKLIGLIGPALVPNYSGSLFEALTVLGGLAGVLFGAFLLLEWPRRIKALEEGPYYGSVAVLFLVGGVVLEVTGAA